MASFSAILISPSRQFTFPFKSLSSHQSLPLRTITMKQPLPSNRRYWLLKTEPNVWSWTDQSTNGGVSNWDGVKNKQAIKSLKSMKLNDLCFFYHSGNKSRCIVGVVEIVKECYDDGNGGVVVDVKEVGEMRRIVDLKEMKRDLGLKGFGLLRQPRLSVVEVSEEIWVIVCGMGDGFVGDGRVEIEGCKSGDFVVDEVKSE